MFHEVCMLDTGQEHRRVAVALVLAIVVSWLISPIRWAMHRGTSVDHSRMDRRRRPSSLFEVGIIIDQLAYVLMEVVSLGVGHGAMVFIGDGAVFGAGKLLAQE